MSYVSNDSRLWWNLPGVVAAYQPVRAPGPLLARYNQAHGGRNSFKIVDGIAPIWNATSGFTFNGSNQYVRTGVVPDETGSLIIKFSGASVFGDNVLIGSRSSSSIGMFIQNSNGLSRVYVNGALMPISGTLTSGVMAIAYNQGYLNGLPDGTAFIPSAYAIAYDIYIGCLNNSGSPLIYRAARVQAVAYYARTLSATEVWYASLQMRYCDVNPDWSAWGRRRRWFYAAATAAARPTWLGEWWGG